MRPCAGRLQSGCGASGHHRGFLAAAAGDAEIADLGPRPGNGRTPAVGRASRHDVYFCDPRSPSQRGSNENTNRLLRQYLTKGVDLQQFSIRNLDDFTERINTRPRQVLDWNTSHELFCSQVCVPYVP
jgi:hypothetical protein